MKNGSLLIVILSTFLFLSNSTNPPNGRTGAPGEGTCNSCHTGNAPIQGLVTIEGISERVNPGETYDITVRSSVSSGSASRAGFQLVALNQNNQNAGTLSDPGANVAFDMFNNKRYAEHRPAKNLDGNQEAVFQFKWTAPEENEGEAITFYVASVLANGNGGSSGDRVVTNSFSTLLEAATNTVEPNFAQSIKTYPNPASNYIAVESSGLEINQKIHLILTDSRGAIKYRSVANANSIHEILIQNFPSGIYFLSIQSGAQIYQQKIIKI